MFHRWELSSTFGDTTSDLPRYMTLIFATGEVFPYMGIWGPNIKTNITTVSHMLTKSLMACCKCIDEMLLSK